MSEVKVRCSAAKECDCANCTERKVHEAHTERGSGFGHKCTRYGFCSYVSKFVRCESVK